MTPERIEQERKAFEAWMIELYPTNPQTERVGGEYSRLGTQYKWEGWQAKAAQSEWISVEDRLPEESERFLVRYESTSDETPYTTIVYYNATNRTFHSLFLRIDQENPITHWQPLPEPPETRGK